MKRIVITIAWHLAIIMSYRKNNGSIKNIELMTDDWLNSSNGIAK